jgi:hypothetical protein
VPADQHRLAWPAPVLTPGEGLDEPRLWVRRLRLWHDFDDEPVREIEFRRGLNIIWSPAGTSAAEVSTGHAAGKTLLCRQVRFCLGEESFADPDDTIAIQTKFRNGGVGAEIRLRGETWVVRRAFSSPADDRAKKSDEIADLASDAYRGTFSSFRAELGAVAFGDAQRQLLADLDDVEVPWQYVLAWLTRDQECRLDGLTHWRHPDSSSHSPVRKSAAETRLNVLRVALGLYSAQSSAVRKRVADAAKAVSRAESDARQFGERFRVLRKDLARALALDEGEIWPPPEDLLQGEESAREAHFRKLSDLTDDLIRAVRPVEISAEQRADEDQMQSARAELAEAEQQTEGANESVKTANAHLELLTIKTAEAWAELRRAKHPTCPYDDTPIDVAGAQVVCPLPRLPDPDAAQNRAVDTDAHRDKIVQELAAQQKRLAMLMGQRAFLRSKVEKLERRIGAHQLAMAQASAASQAAWASKGTLQFFIDAVKDQEEAQAQEKQEKAAQKLVSEHASAHLGSYSTAKLTTWFDFLVTRIVASAAKGEITLDGNGLHPTIQWRGRRRSVALNSLRLVLFDLAAMLCAVEGAASAPAFLLHDSPREGDLDPGTYARLFETAFNLGHDEESAPFQYIVTTTTEPPEGEIRERVRAVLSAQSDETRFFKVDL